MRYVCSWLPAFGVFLLLAANALADPRLVPVAAPDGTASRAPASSAGQSTEEQELRVLLDKLSELSRLIDQNNQSPRAWEYHLEQAEVLLRLATFSQGKDRENSLRTAVDGFYGAALLCPREQPAAYDRLQQLPQRIAQAFPGSAAIHYAVLQEIQADCMRVLDKTGDEAKAREHRCARLLQFARQHPESPETPKTILEAAHVSESLGKTADASRFYRYLIEHYADNAAARKASGALWRLGQSQEPVHVELPLLYASGNASEAAFDLRQLGGSLVVLYFWSSTSPHVAEDFEVLKQLTDRYMGRGLEMVYVNMDADPKQARAFLSGRLTAGTHLYQAGGLDGKVAERYGIQETPQAFLLGKDGNLLRHSLPAARLEAEIAGSLQRGR